MVSSTFRTSFTTEKIHDDLLGTSEMLKSLIEEIEADLEDLETELSIQEECVPSLKTHHGPLNTVLLKSVDDNELAEKRCQQASGHTHLQQAMETSTNLLLNERGDVVEKAQTDDIYVANNNDTLEQNLDSITAREVSKEVRSKLLEEGGDESPDEKQKSGKLKRRFMEISQAKFECSSSRKKAKEEEKIKKLEEFEAAEEGKKQKEISREISWGRDDDAMEVESFTDMQKNPFDELANNESLYIDDPKKALKNWFEREGYELEFKVEEKGYAQFHCRINLPVDGEPNFAEAQVKGNQKEAVIQAALEAFRVLDRLGE